MWYKKSKDEIFDELHSKETGLTAEEAAKKLEKYGLNELKEEEANPFIYKLIDQFKDVLILILLIAAGVSFAVGERTDAIIILAIVFINAFLGIYQEGKAEKTLEALKEMASPEARLIRDGREVILPSAQITKGDIVLLEAGDIVPADIRFIETANLQVDESSLTGESVPVEKEGNLVYEEDRELGDRANMAFSSSIVSYGRGKGIAIATGKDTEIGKIADTLASYKDEMTPLQKKLDQLGKMLGILVLIICGLVFLVGLFYKNPILEMFLVAVALAVAAIPEGLPAIVTIVLSLGMSRMAQKNAIVKKLSAVETLGTTTYICSDKTGTLTQNEMTVTKIFVDNKVLDISGIGYEPNGEISFRGEEIEDEQIPSLYTLLSIAILNNDAHIEKNDNQYNILGDPTEGALLTLASKKGLSQNEMNEIYPRIAELSFDSNRKMMTTFHKNFIKEKIVSFTKGAPDIILSKCKWILEDGKKVKLDDKKRQTIQEQNINFARSALRVLAFAIKDYENLPEKLNPEEIEEDLIFVGLAGMIDPPREEAKLAIKECRRAGIVPVMITGDFKETAFAIAKELDMAQSSKEAVTGAELSGLTDREMEELVKEKRVYARVSPDHKVRIVEALKANGEIVAMTGDGVNDALAIRRANIGIAMGITGTDVAKNTAEIILTDDNFASIVSATKEGRIIYSNIRKFVLFLLSCNIAEILVVLVAILMNLPIPLLPIQLLWLNLVTDSFPALALGLEPGDDDIMDYPPRDTEEAILDKPMQIGIITQSIAIAAVVILIYLKGLQIFPNQVNGARTMAFATLILAELIRSYSTRSEHYTLRKLGLLSNKHLINGTTLSFILMILVMYVPFLQKLFHTITLGLYEWLWIIPGAIIPFLVGELYKKIKYSDLN